MDSQSLLPASVLENTLHEHFLHSKGPSTFANLLFGIYKYSFACECKQSSTCKSFLFLDASVTCRLPDPLISHSQSSRVLLGFDMQPSHEQCAKSTPLQELLCNSRVSREKAHAQAACLSCSVGKSCEELVKLPPVLAIRLDRTAGTSDVGLLNRHKVFKNCCAVAIPLLLSVAGHEFELAVVLGHTGKLVSKGHYYVNAKRGNQWFRFDDEKSNAIVDSSALQVPILSTKSSNVNGDMSPLGDFSHVKALPDSLHVVSSEAYVLFYHSRNYMYTHQTGFFRADS